MADYHNLVFGFHGCEKSVARDVLLNRARLNPSNNDYDWLGNGIYFWENDPNRALEFARDVKNCKNPFVIGAILDLNYCLDLTCRDSLDVVSLIWKQVVEPIYLDGQIKTNKPAKRGENGELLLRFLDCYVIEALHNYNEENDLEQYDSVRGAFWEGNYIYPTAGFFDKSHIQLCIRNYDCIKGIFLPDNFIL